MIDNVIGTKQVVCDCITQNTLRSLLIIAKLNQPILIRTMVMNKTKNMRHVDLILRDKHETSIKACLETLRINDKDPQGVMERINDTKAKIDKNEAHLRKAREYLRQAATLGFVHHIIEHIDILAQNIKILEQAVGVGQDSLAIKVRRETSQNGLCHVKIYLTRRKKFTEEIEKTEATLCDSRMTTGRTSRSLRKSTVNRKELLNDLKKNLFLLGRVSSPNLDVCPQPQEVLFQEEGRTR
ncbi:hypothetical protein CPB97_007795 [Podila verticillata]|nr:hypothetical protein CPB97_007795 [Podila verticillata]